MWKKAFQKNIKQIKTKIKTSQFLMIRNLKSDILRKKRTDKEESDKNNFDYI